MFQFSGFAHLSMYYVFNIVGCPIRISTDQFVCANPRSFSQLITSFFASESLGIPHTPSFCLLYFCIIVINHNNTCSFYFLNIFLSQYVNELVPFGLWRITESNRWPPACKAGALASWANPPLSVGSVQYSVFSNFTLHPNEFVNWQPLEFP